MSFTELDTIPAGVEIVKHYPTLKGTLVQCTHHARHRTDLLGRERCTVCKADELTSLKFTLPVRFMAAIPDVQVTGQLSLR